MYLCHIMCVVPTQLPVDLHGCECEADIVRGKDADEEFGPKKEEVTREWGTLRNRGCMI
jgi:hypothetical protein